MVNLLLCGRAHSNVFNGTKTMEGAAESGDSVILRGVPARCTFSPSLTRTAGAMADSYVAASIGFITLFEHYGYVAVGSHYHVRVTTLLLLLCRIPLPTNAGFFTAAPREPDLGGVQ